MRSSLLCAALMLSACLPGFDRSKSDGSNAGSGGTGLALRPLRAGCSRGSGGARLALRSLRTWRALRAWWALGYSFIVVLVILVGVCQSSPGACQYQEKKAGCRCESRASFLIPHAPPTGSRRPHH